MNTSSIDYEILSIHAGTGWLELMQLLFCLGAVVKYNVLDQDVLLVKSNELEHRNVNVSHLFFLSVLK